MTIQYGAKPFFKGLIHALFHHHWLIQLYLLSGVELVVMLLTLLWELVLERHKSMMVLVLELLYSVCLIGLNVLMMFKYEYLSEDEDGKEEMELYLKLVVYLMLILLVMRVLT